MVSKDTALCENARLDSLGESLRLEKKRRMSSSLMPTSESNTVRELAGDPVAI